MLDNLTPEETSNTNQVECYSGIEYAERPRAFVWQGTHYQVAEIQVSRLTPDGKYFQVRTNSDQVFILFYNPTKSAWEISPW